jgi:hypothetical protein
LIKINELEYERCVVDLSELCDKAKSRVSMRVDKESCKNKIDALKENGFSGVVKLISEFREVLSKEIIVLDSGKIKLFFIEEDGESEGIKTVYCDTGEGLLELYECSDAQMKKFYGIIEEGETPPKTSDVKPYSVKEIEKIIEAYLVIKKYGKAGPLERVEQE